MTFKILSAEDQKTLLKFGSGSKQAALSAKSVEHITRQERSTLEQLGLIARVGVGYRLTGLGFRTIKQLTAK